jgi:hypothetical protein
MMRGRLTYNERRVLTYDTRLLYDARMLYGARLTCDARSFPEDVSDEHAVRPAGNAEVLHGLQDHTR